MDISFMTSAGGGAWSLTECADWAAAHGFDCVRLNDSGALDSDHILAQGPDEVVETLARRGLYLACISAHCNLLDDDEGVRRQQAERLGKALRSAQALGCPVVVCGSGAPLRRRAQAAARTPSPRWTPTTPGRVMPGASVSTPTCVAGNPCGSSRKFRCV